MSGINHDVAPLRPPAVMAFDEQRCPCCGDAGQLEYGRFDMETHSVWQVGTCGSCGAEWAECYAPASVYIREPGASRRAPAIDSEHPYTKQP